MTRRRQITQRLIVKKFCGGWHVWIGGGDIPSRWLSAAPSQAAAMEWCDSYIRAARSTHQRGVR